MSNMLFRNTIRLFSLVILSMLAANTLATPVGPMNYQGRLLDNSGVPVTGSYNFTARIYDDPSAGVLKYEELHSAVSVNDGVYSFKIGTFAPTGTGAGDSQWDINLWQANLNDLYLEIVVDGETLSPRFELTSSPHAYTSTFALSADALGNKTAAEYDNILEGVCSASKGKWLDNIERCLGVGATVTSENAATMASDLDYTDLDLTEADVTNTQFVNADFSNTLFHKTILTIDNFYGANMTGARLDNVTSTNTMSAISIDFSNATITNMDLTGWNFSNATLTGLSAANLTGCPGSEGVLGSNLPANWMCKEMINGSGRYILLGPGANLSATSEAALAKHGYRLLDLERDTLQNIDINGASLEGIDLSGMEIKMVDLSNANMDYTTIDAGIIEQTNLTGTSFRYSRLTNTTLEQATVTDNNFENAVLDTVVFFDNTDNMNFNRSRLTRVTFGTMHSPTFNQTYFDNSQFQGDITGTLDLSDSRIYNSTNFNQGYTGPLTASPQNLDDMEVRAFGDQGNFVFVFPAGETIDNLYMEYLNLDQTDFSGTTFTNCEIYNVQNQYSYPPNMQDATFDGCLLNVIDFGCDGASFEVNIINSTIRSSTLNAVAFSNGLDDSCSIGPAGTTDPGFLNVTFDDVQFTGDWSKIVDSNCSGCTFINSDWNGAFGCPDGSPKVEVPPASGTYQCPGWY